MTPRSAIAGHVLDDLEAETGQAEQALRRTHHAHAAHAEIGEDLCADAEGAQLRAHRRLGRLDPLVVQLVIPDTPRQRADILLAAQQEDDAAGRFARHTLHRGPQAPARLVEGRAQHVVQAVLHVDPHQHRLGEADLAAHQGEMQLVIGCVVIGLELEVADLSFSPNQKGTFYTESPLKHN